MRLAWNIRRLLEKLGMSEWKAFGIEIKINNFEEWLSRHPISRIMIVVDPKDCLNEWKTFSVSVDEFKLASKTGRWRNSFVFTAKATPVVEKSK